MNPTTAAVIEHKEKLKVNDNNNDCDNYSYMPIYKIGKIRYEV
jgi:hypothetical protein